MNAFLMILVAAPVVGWGADAEFDLVRNGKPVVEIVYADGSAANTKSLSREQQRLRDCIEDFRQIVKRISGAELRVVSASEADHQKSKNTIQVGLTPVAVENGLGQRVGGFKPHSLLIHADANNNVLYLLGSSLEGSGHALYEFLESLGCRWYMSGPFGEQLPSMKTISVGKLDLVREPEFELRAIQLRARSTVAPGTKTRGALPCSLRGR